MSDTFSYPEDIFHLANLSSVHADLPFSVCFILAPSSLVYVAYYITNIIILSPVCIFILHLGLHQWRSQGSTSVAAMMSHSDSFTYNIVIMELIAVLGFILCCCGLFTSRIRTFTVGYCLWTFTWYGEMFFHILTCVERYLAVVHPITYRNLRSKRGSRIRNSCIGFVWLLSSGGAGWITLKTISTKSNLILYCLSLFIIIFCSISVLCVLIRPGPGQQGGDRERVDQPKKRAFYTIVAILTLLILRFLWGMTWASLFVSHINNCVMMAVGVWFNFPSSLVLPLLFLQRVGVSAWCRNEK